MTATAKSEIDDLVEISAPRVRSFVAKWRKLEARRAKVDFETAQLAAEIREEFPRGPAGDYQFRIWCCHHLEVYGATAAMLSRAARAYGLFPREEDWAVVSGWQSMGFLLSLKRGGRRQVFNRVKKLAQERERPVGYSTVRNLAYALGVRQDSKFGRPNRLQVEENLGFLRHWVEKLYSDYEDLPKMPPEVQEAMKPTKLGTIADSLSDRR